MSPRLLLLSSLNLEQSCRACWGKAGVKDRQCKRLDSVVRLENGNKRKKQQLEEKECRAPFVTMYHTKLGIPHC